MAVERPIFIKPQKRQKQKEWLLSVLFFYQQQVLENQILLLIKSTKFGKN